jgi:hypothetical protein
MCDEVHLMMNLNLTLAAYTSVTHWARFVHV